MTTEVISSTAGIVLSLIFSYVPGLRDRYNELSPDGRRVVMLLALAVVVSGSLLLSCAGQANTYLCNQDGVWTAIRAFVAALVANQATYQIVPQKK